VQLVEKVSNTTGRHFSWERRHLACNAPQGPRNVLSQTVVRAARSLQARCLRSHLTWRRVAVLTSFSNRTDTRKTVVGCSHNITLLPARPHVCQPWSPPPIINSRSPSLQNLVSRSTTAHWC